MRIINYWENLAAYSPLGMSSDPDLRLPRVTCSDVTGTDYLLPRSQLKRILPSGSTDTPRCCPGALLGCATLAEVSRVLCCEALALSGLGSSQAPPPVLSVLGSGSSPRVRIGFVCWENLRRVQTGEDEPQSPSVPWAGRDGRGCSCRHPTINYAFL